MKPFFYRVFIILLALVGFFIVLQLIVPAMDTILGLGTPVPTEGMPCYGLVVLKWMAGIAVFMEVARYFWPNDSAGPATTKP